MLTIRTAAQIRGAHNLRSSRSCASSTGLPMQCVDVRRIVHAEAGLANSELRRQWLARQWKAHAAQRLEGS